MSDVTGFIVALLAAEKVGIVKKWGGMKKKTSTGTVYTYDPGVDTTINIGSQTFSGKLECRTWFNNRGLPIPQKCR